MTRQRLAVLRPCTRCLPPTRGRVGASAASTARRMPLATHSHTGALPSGDRLPAARRKSGCSAACEVFTKTSSAAASRRASNSPAKLAAALVEGGHEVSANTVAKLLSEKLEYSRQFNRKTLEGASHPDRNAQFEHINAKVVAAQAAGHPVISVDTKKKELVGNFRNGGSDYRPKGDPHRVKVHDFEDKALGKVVPYGVYDVGANAGWVSLGITSDTAEFAVNAIRTWIERIGRQRYPHMRELTITADCGGSNGARVRLWKVELQKLADESGLTLRVLHYPPGTSKWNRIEHRMFCHITQNWRGQPLESRIAVVELIGATTTKTGLTIECALDERTYEKGIRIKKSEMKRLDIEGDAFHPEWNYAIKPRRSDP